METHEDRDFSAGDRLFNELKSRALDMTRARQNLITAGAENEQPLEEWQSGSMIVKKLADDQQGVLRISVGGNVGFGYCVFRGSRQACRTLLEQAWKALEL